MEVWDEEKEKFDSDRLPYPTLNRYSFGYLAVPESVICDKSTKK